MKITGIFKTALCAVLAAAVLTGCSGNENLKDLSVVEGMGIEYEDGRMSVTVQSLNLTKEGSGAEALSGNITMNAQGTGENISAAVQKTAESLSKKLFFGQNQILVIGMELAENNLYDCFDYLVRNSDSRPDVAVCISSGKANEALSSGLNGALVPAQAMSELLYNGEEEGFAVYVTVNEMLNLYKDKTSDVYLPVVTAEKDNTAVSGIAVYNGLRLVNILPETQILGFLLLTDKIDSGYFEFESDTYGRIGAEISNSSTKTKARVENGTVVYSVDISSTLSVEELQNGAEGMISEKDLKTIASQAEKELEGKCRDAFESCVMNGSDCLRIGESLAAGSPADYAALSDNWKETLSSVRLEVSGTCKLKKVNENASGY